MAVSRPRRVYRDTVLDRQQVPALGEKTLTRTQGGPRMDRKIGGEPLRVIEHIEHIVPHEVATQVAECVVRGKTGKERLGLLAWMADFDPARSCPDDEPPQRGIGLAGQPVGMGHEDRPRRLEEWPVQVALEQRRGEVDTTRRQGMIEGWRVGRAAPRERPPRQ